MLRDGVDLLSGQDFVNHEKEATMNNLSSFMAGVLVGGGAVLLLSPQSEDRTPWILNEIESHTQDSLENAAARSSTAISTMQRKEPIMREMIRDGSRNAL